MLRPPMTQQKGMMILSIGLSNGLLSHQLHAATQTKVQSVAIESPALMLDSMNVPIDRSGLEYLNMLAKLATTAGSTSLDQPRHS